ncbi:MAG: hypothetical protein PHZ17_01695 [Sulfurovum sp.]|nr:hypothetical protein [Sulfurovum sp.]
MYEKLRRIRKELLGIDAPVMKSREVFRQISLKDLGREKPSSPSKRRKLKNYLDEDDLVTGLDGTKDKK